MRVQQRIGAAFLVIGLSIGSYIAGVASGSNHNAGADRAETTRMSSEFAAFATAVYRPACVMHKGLKSVNLPNQTKGIAAFPAMITCVDKTKAMAQGISWSPR